jgi:hypothetical protein
MDNTERIASCLMAFLFLAAGLLGGAACGSRFTEEACRREAVEAGAAEYRVDPRTGVTEFLYKK